MRTCNLVCQSVATVLVALLQVACCIGSAQAQAYRAILLTPAPVGNSYALGADGGLVVGFVDTVNAQLPMVWSATTGAIVKDLSTPAHPSGIAFGISGSKIVGDTAGYGQAYSGVVWDANTGAVTPLSAKGMNSVYALGIHGNAICGVGEWSLSRFNAGADALLWATAIGPVSDLNPSSGDYIDTEAIATDGKQTVGFGYSLLNYYEPYGLLWNGTSTNPVVLCPGYDSVNGVANGEQVGQVGNDGVIWHGTAASKISLTPTGYYGSSAMGTNGQQEVGWAGLDYSPVFDGPLYQHAMVWSGSSKRFVDLQQFLPSQFVSSVAYAIDSNGNVVGAASKDNFYYQAVLWRVHGPTAGGGGGL